MGGGIKLDIFSTSALDGGEWSGTNSSHLAFRNDTQYTKDRWLDVHWHHSNMMMKQFTDPNKTQRR